MYNQIDQVECICVIAQLAEDKGWIHDKKTEDTWRFYFALIEWVFNSSYVAFMNVVYKQKRGLPMGSPLSPVIANLFMAGVEHLLFKDARESMFDMSYIKYFRFLDDILMIMEYDVWAKESEPLHPAKLVAEDILRNMSLIANDSNINFESTGEAWRPRESVEYLDLKLTVTKLRRNDFVSIALSVFDKPTNLHIYTDPSTFYPLHYVYGWIQGENIRYIRNSSDEMSYEQQLHKFKQFLFRRKYLETKIDRHLALNVYSDRTALLRGEKPHKDRKEQGKGNSKQDVHVMIENSGSRSIITRAVKTIDNVMAMHPNFGLRFVPTVRKGKSILSVMNQLRNSKQS